MYSSAMWGNVPFTVLVREIRTAVRPRRFVRLQVTQSWRWRIGISLEGEPRKKKRFTVGAVTWVWHTAARPTCGDRAGSRQMRGRRTLRSVHCQPFSHGYRFLVMIKQVPLGDSFISLVTMFLRAFCRGLQQSEKNASRKVQLKKNTTKERRQKLLEIC